MIGIDKKIAHIFWLPIIAIVCILCIHSEGQALSPIPPNVPFKNIPAELIQKGNDFIISKVGEKYFHENYRIKESSACAESQNKISYCMLNYSQSVFEKLGSNKEIVLIFSPDEPITGSPVLISENNKPIVSKDLAIEAAKSKLKDYQINHPEELNLTSLLIIKNDFTMFKNDVPMNSYMWEIVFGEQYNYDQNNNCYEGYLVYVDAYSGEAFEVTHKCSLSIPLTPQQSPNH